MLSTISAALVILKEFFTIGYKLWNLFKEAKRNGWITEGRTLSSYISEAKTDEERAALARRLFNHRTG